MKQDFLNTLDEPATDYAGTNSGENQEEDKIFKASRALEKSWAPALPKINDDGEHRSRVQHDEQKCHFWRCRIQTEKLFRYHDVGGTGNGQQFGEALDNGQDDYVQKAHRLSLVSEMI
jgi:hypothetical protein